MTEEIQPPAHGVGGLLAGGGVFTGLGALLGASCCVLPILLVQLGVSTAFVAHLSLFANAKPFLMAATALIVAGGFITAFWGGRRPRRSVLVLLICAALLVAASSALPYFEGHIVRWMRLG